MLAALSLLPSQGHARDARRAGQSVVEQIAPLEADPDEDIIYIMPPMRPVRGMAQAHKPAPKPVEKPAPAVAAKPAPVKQAEGAPAPVAQAPKPADLPPPVMEAPAPALPQTVAEQPQPVDAQAAVESQPIEGRGVAEPPASQMPEPVTAEAPIVVQPAPVGAPVMILNPPRKALSAMKEPVAILDPHIIEPAEDSASASFVPMLESPAKLAASASAIADAEQGAPVAQAPADAQTPPLDPSLAQADAEARIGALLAQGVVGPSEVRLGDGATLWLPAGRVFIPPEPARELAKEAGLEWRAGVQGLIAPAGGQLQWLAPVEVVDDGYIRTDDADALQPDKLLAAFEAGLPEINAQRSRGGQPPVALGGWLTAPALDEKHRLAGCVNVTTQNDQNGLDRFFNCEAWALGRHGAIKIALADGGEEAERLKGEAVSLADAIVFDRDKAYEAFDAATDKVAPYTAADLLTRDVAAQKSVASAESAEGASGGADLTAMLSKLLEPALLGAAVLGAYVWYKRSKAGEVNEAETARASAPVDQRGRRAAAEKPAEAPASLFARLLPTLHARFAKTSEAPAAILDEAPVVDAPRMRSPAAPAPKAEAASDQLSAAAGLLAKLSRLRGGEKAEEAALSRPPTLGAAPVNDADEPASALKKLAARMRGSNGDAQPAAPVNVSRAIRPTRTLPGAAPAVAEKLPEPVMAEPMIAEPMIAEPVRAEPKVVEPEMAAPLVFEPALVEPSRDRRAAEPMEPEQPVIAMGPPKRQEAPAKQSVFDDDDFGLVEPGDVEAASAAINKARAANGTQG